MLKAFVTRSTGKTRPLVLQEGSEGRIDGEIGTPKWLEITEERGSYFLLRLDEQGVCTADTWHATLAQAKAQAAFEYGIEEADWLPSDPSTPTP